MNNPIFPSWSFELDKIHPYAWWDSFLTLEECEKIIKYANFLNSKIKATVRSDDLESRKSNITWMPPSEEIRWLYERLTSIITKLNNQFFHFDLFGIIEPLQFTNYKAPKGKFDMHIDNSYNTVIRKLSISIQLTDPKKYKGGDLNLYLDRKKIAMKKEQGCLIAFPSYVLHEVTPIIKGERNSLVVWITGKSFT